MGQIIGGINLQDLPIIPLPQTTVAKKNYVQLNRWLANSPAYTKQYF
jgi:hypothetical protein